jgi:hypothetical protein
LLGTLIVPVSVLVLSLEVLWRIGLMPPATATAAPAPGTSSRRICSGPGELHSHKDVEKGSGEVVSDEQSETRGDSGGGDRGNGKGSAIGGGGGRPWFVMGRIIMEGPKGRRQFGRWWPVDFDGWRDGTVHLFFI